MTYYSFSRLILAPIFFFSWGLNLSFGTTGVELSKASSAELRQLAESGDAYAQAALAIALANGDRGFPISIIEAEKWARQSASQKHPIGYFAMGYLSQNPMLEADSATPGKYFLAAFGDRKGELVRTALSGDPIACYALGMILTSDELRPRMIPDLELAARHHQVAIDAGYMPSVLQLGILKMEGMLAAKDMEGGLALVRQAVSINLPGAHNYMGVVNLKGRGMPEDRGTALVHFRKAADLGHGTSMMITAHFYASGLATPVDLDLASVYARRAAAIKESGAEDKILEIQALAESGALVATSSGVPEPVESGVPPPPPPPRSSGNFPPSPPPLPAAPGPGVTTSTPTYIPRAPNPAETTFVPVAPPPASPPLTIPTPPPPTTFTPTPSFPAPSSTSAADTRELAKRHYSGIGIPVDYITARSNFVIAANAGDVEAARYLGIIYLRGKGVAKDRVEAAKWLRMAAAGGDVMAKRNLELLEQLLAP
jgi:TPR repeat protein